MNTRNLVLRNEHWQLFDSGNIVSWPRPRDWNGLVPGNVIRVRNDSTSQEKIAVIRRVSEKQGVPHMDFQKPKA